MMDVFPKLTTQEKHTVLKNYYLALTNLHTIELIDKPYGNLVESQDSVTDDTWQGFLIKKLHMRLTQSSKIFREDVVNLEAKIVQLEELVAIQLYSEKKFLFMLIIS